MAVIFKTLSILLLCAPLLFARESSRPHCKVPTITEAPRIDGDLMDPAWKKAVRIKDFTEVEPNEGQPADPKTEVLMMRDGENLYVAFICHEPDPKGLVLHDMHRDGFQSEDDAAKIVIDTFQDGKSAYYFLLDAAGGRLDALIADNGQRSNYSWDGFWKARSLILRDRWIAEFAIPFKSMAFGEQDRWRINFERYRGSDRSRYRWCGYERNLSIRTISECGEISGMKGLEQGLGLEFSPYIKFKRSRQHDPRSASNVGDAGGEINWRITPQLLGSFTMNTDFAETEADARRINLTRYNLFFPEKRDFFLQDANQFAFGWGSGFRGNSDIIPFFSRRIGLASNGEEIPIEYGAKVSGRYNEMDLGLLAVHTGADSTAEVPAGNLMVARPAWRWTEELTLGGILTHGNPASKKNNLVGGADLRYSSTQLLPGLFTLTSYFLRSDDEETDDLGSAYGFRTSLATTDWSYSLETLYAQDKFHPALGFVRRPGEKRYAASVSWSPRPDSEWIRNYSFSLSPSMWTKSDGSTISKSLSTNFFSLNWHSGDRFYLNHHYNFDKVESDFTLVSGDVIPKGSYDWQALSAGIRFSKKRKLSGNVSVTGGGWYQGRSIRYDASSVWNPVANLELGLSYNQNRVLLPGGNFTTRIETLNLNYDFTPDLRLATLVQADNVSDNLGLQSRFKWIYEDGKELHLVVNSSWVKLDPHSIVPVEHDFTVKLQYAFRF